MGETLDGHPSVRFGRLLAGLRLSGGWSQEELADRSGLSVRAIRDLERGRVGRPRRTSVALLAGALALTDAERAAFEEAADGLAIHEGGRAALLLRPDPAIPCQLPPDIEEFTGRDLVLGRLGSMTQGRRGSGAALIAVIGMAGVCAGIWRWRCGSQG